MRNQNSKVRVTKRKLTKCKDVCRTFSPLQYAFADMLVQNPDVSEFRCNVPLVGLELDGVYTTDFVITKLNGDIAVRECVLRDKISKPLNPLFSNNCTQSIPGNQYLPGNGIAECFFLSKTSHIITQR